MRNTGVSSGGSVSPSSVCAKIVLGRMRFSSGKPLLAHDNHNSVKRAANKSNTWLCVLEWSLIANWTRAPFNSHVNWEHFSSAMKDMWAYIRGSNFTAELWLAFYEAIAKRLGLWDPDLGFSEDHMESVLKACENLSSLCNIGDSVKLSRWYSVWDRWDEKLDKLTEILLMVMIYVGLFKGCSGMVLWCSWA